MKPRAIVFGALLSLILGPIGGMFQPVVAAGAAAATFSASASDGGPAASQSGSTDAAASLNSGLLTLGGCCNFAPLTYSSQAAANAGPHGLHASARSTADSAWIGGGFINSVTPYGEGIASEDFPDIVISGPPGGTTSVPVSLNLSMDGTIFATAYKNPAYCSCDVGAISKVGLAGNFSGFTFSGHEEVGSGGQVSRTGVLANFPGAGNITSPTENLPVGSPLDLSLQLDVQSLAWTGGSVYVCGADPCGVGSSTHADSDSDFSNTVTFPGTGPVFNLPPGYTVDAPSAGIVNNHYLGGTAPADTTPPVITVSSSPIIAEATGPDGAAVTFAATANDPDDGALPVTCTPSSGSTFPLGSTTVTCTAKDQAGNVGTASFTVLVQDTTPPDLTLPSDISVNATSPAGAQVLYGATAVDLVDGVVPVSCIPPSGAIFAIGSTTVSCSASDSHGNTATGSFNVHVKGAAEQLADLQQLVTQNKLGPGSSLSDKLAAVQTAVAAGDQAAACGGLEAFINEVHAQSGKKLTTNQASALHSDATRVMAVLGC